MLSLPKKHNRAFWLLASGFWLLVSACGFQPMYGNDPSAGNPLRGNIALDAPPKGDSSHEVQLLHTALEDKFNPEGASTVNASYHLSFGLTTQLIPSVIKSDGTIQRYDVHCISSFKLFKAGNPAPVLAGDMRRTGSYNAASNAGFATYEAGQDTIRRVIEEMAEDYVMRVSAFLATHP